MSKKNNQIEIDIAVASMEMLAKEYRRYNEIVSKNGKDTFMANGLRCSIARLSAAIVKTVGKIQYDAFSG
jgi:hypothetical protein